MTLAATHLTSEEIERCAFDPPGAHLDSHRAHLANCAACHSAVEGLEQERRAFLKTHPFDRVVSSKVRNTSFAGPWGLRLLVPVAAGLGIAGIVISSEQASGPPAEIVFRDSGAPTLRLFLSRGGDRAQPIDLRQALHAGDILRFHATSAKDGFAHLVSIDSRGNFSAYLPLSGSAPVLIRGGLGDLLPGSIVLDDFVGQELIALVMSREPVSEARLREAVTTAFTRAKGRLDSIKSLPDFPEASLVTILKAPR